MRTEKVQGQRILLSPLNWGMGHVARCIPLINQLIQQKNEIIIACNFEQEQVFKTYFSDLIYEQHEGYPFSFAGTGNFEMDVLKQFFKLNKRLRKEKKEVEKWVKKHTIDLVISDHRYGFISKKCTSIFITHQLNLPVSGFMKTGDFIHKKLIRSFQEIWVLDTPESKFAGKLSRNSHFENVCYIGPKSRFSLSPKIEKTIPLVVIISGPEPYAEQLFKEQYGKATLSLEKTCIITPKLYLEESDSTQIDIILSSDWKKADLIISQAKKIISRSGYSTIMDLNYLETEFELIPTQGQKEQEYLHQIITQP